MTVSSGDGQEDVADVSVPWKLHLLDETNGYVSHVEPAVERAIVGSQVATRLVILLVGVLTEQAMAQQYAAAGLKRSAV